MNEKYWNTAILQDRDTLWLKHPCSRSKEGWMTSWPLGNGYTGALFFGAAGSDVLRLTRHDLWAGGRCIGEMPDLSGALQGMREKMDRNDWPSANFDMMNALRASGYRQEIAEPFPLGQMQLTAADIDMPFTHYRRGLRMGDAEAFARWNYGAYRSLRRSFVSQADGLVWFSIEEDRPLELELTLSPVKQVREHPLLDAVAKAGKIQIKDSTVVFDTQVEDRRIGIAAQVLPAEGSFVEEKDQRFPEYHQ